jgi:RNA polymerase subunit RPABC4/transcription elongation factor Spt4
VIKFVQTGVAGGVWVGADEECPSCNSKFGTGSGTTKTPSFCDSVTGPDKEQCEQCSAKDRTSYARCMLSKLFNYTSGLDQ